MCADRFSQLGRNLWRVVVVARIRTTHARHGSRMSRMALGAIRGPDRAARVGLRATTYRCRIAVGRAAASVGMRLLSSLLDGVRSTSSTDAGPFAVASCLFAAVALATSYVPPRRAILVDLIIALRYEESLIHY
jgi:hypothetical protein